MTGAKVRKKKFEKNISLKKNQAERPLAEKKKLAPLHDGGPAQLLNLQVLLPLPLLAFQINSFALVGFSNVDFSNPALTKSLLRRVHHVVSVWKTELVLCPCIPVFRFDCENHLSHININIDSVLLSL